MNQVASKLAIACGVLLASVPGLLSQPLSIYTLAGQAAQGSADGIGGDARFSLPLGIAADSAGNVYVADTGNSTIRKITPDGVVITLAGFAGNFGSTNGTGTNAQFYGPQGIAADSAGFLYIADTANATIRKISPAGMVSTIAGMVGSFNSFDGAGTNAQFFQPEGLAVDGAGNVYVADAWNHTIRKITPAGVAGTLAGLAGNFGSIDGTNSKARFNRPSGIALDSATNLFVTDSFNHTLRKLTPSGTVSTLAGLAGVWGNADGTNNAARFFQPEGIVSLDMNTLFVIDSGNQTVRKISAKGTNWVVSTVAGLAGISGNANGTGNGAHFSFPAGLALDSTGHLYIADSGNNTIRTTRVLPPTLHFSVSVNQLVLSWPTSASGFVLEKTTALSPGTAWTPLTNGVVIMGDGFTLASPLDTAAAFYRLHKP